MVKRKKEDEPALSGESTLGAGNLSGEESSSDDEGDVVDVDFEWFDPQPEHDFHGIKTLLRQLFDDDAILFDLNSLTDLILAQPLLGSTVKVEGNESDPYAFLSVLNINEHKTKAAVENLRSYLAERCASGQAPREIANILTQDSNSFTVGLILTERLINVPAQVVPPMYKMLLEEIAWALEAQEPYKFTHYLVLSKTYRELESALDNAEDNNASKRKKAKTSSTEKSNETFYFHPEDEVLERHALAFGGFEYKNYSSESDSKRAFQDLGIKPQGHAMLIEANKLEAAIQAMQAFVG